MDGLCSPSMVPGRRWTVSGYVKETASESCSSRLDSIRGTQGKMVRNHHREVSMSIDLIDNSRVSRTRPRLKNRWTLYRQSTFPAVRGSRSAQEESEQQLRRSPLLALGAAA